MRPLTSIRVVAGRLTAETTDSNNYNAGGILGMQIKSRFHATLRSPVRLATHHTLLVSMTDVVRRHALQARVR